MRILIKGGVWKNTEDEILKAAVMKYGKNQWARIASLLSRKSAKQCKSRWYEWLDPSIKKTEWTREEEEKLLHLAKLMPTQWRTIAPIVGRTAAQCLEHYEKLLDAAANQTEDPSSTGSLLKNKEDDPRRLRPGEIDPNPETKPARPDPVDMDEDEKEMLSEARARLANTKGKKAKRKAREKQLEEARRLAALQKRREMKAAGIDIPNRRKKMKGIDYNKEIPFQKKPPPGFWEVTAKGDNAFNEFRAVSLGQLEGRLRNDEEAEQRKMDQRKLKRAREENLPSVIMQINKLNDPSQIRKRSRLALPEPQIQDADLEEIGKLQSSSTTALIESSSSSSSSAPTSSLLPTYALTPTPQRTPLRNSSVLQTPSRTPARPDRLVLEAQNLVSLTQGETPLKGGSNTPLNPSDFSGATPKQLQLHTPNPLASPFSTRGSMTPVAGSMTPIQTPRGETGVGIGGGIGQRRGEKFVTPLRDGLGLNADQIMDPSLTPSSSSLSSSSSRLSSSRLTDTTLDREKIMEQRKKVAEYFSSLPAPKNEYEILLPEDQLKEIPKEEEDGHIDDERDVPDDQEEDAIDIQNRKKRAAQRALDAELRARSAVLKKELPRPQAINKSLSIHAVNSKAAGLINNELVSLMNYEAHRWPIGSQPTAHSNIASLPDFEKFSEQELQLAHLLILDETNEVKKELSRSLFSSSSSSSSSGEQNGQNGETAMSESEEKVDKERKETECRRGDII